MMYGSSNITRSFPRKREPKGQTLKCIQVWVPAFAGTNGGLQ